MEHFQNKNLIELFQLGIALNDQKQEVFLKKVALFSPQFAKELKKMFAANPSQIGLSGALDNIKQKQNDINAMHIPKAIGKFKIISILGFGGMGMVFLGEREDINQIVAVKVAHSSKPDSTKTQAITSEAKILASLQHPNIASLVDWGEYENGHYIATEFVKGKTIANYCNEQKLTVIQRIQLFIKIIDAVEFAHDNLIIHRDIKPNNIMVDESGEPILIDFGVARLMESETAVHQQTQNAALTPSFASPEQRTGKNLSIRSDIYSLGAVLLNLVTDSQIDNQTDQSVLPIIENLIEKDHKNNKSTWHKLSRQMRKDLSLILAKSLSFDAKQRYANAFSFKKDLQSLLILKPITAHEPSKWYWFKKFIARNKVVTGILTVAMAAIVFGSWQWKLAVEQKEETVSLGKEYQRYSKFLEKTLVGMNAFEGGSAETTMEKFMDRAVEVYKKEENISPKQMSYHAHVLSKIYNSWSKLDKAIEVLEIGLFYARKSKSIPHIVTILGQKSMLFLNLSKYEQCIETAKEAILIGDQNPEINTQKIAISILLAQCYSSEGKYNQAINLLKKVLNNRASTNLNLAQANYAIGESYGVLYKFQDSLTYFKKAVRLYTEEFGKDTGMAISAQGMAYYIEAHIFPADFRVKKLESLIKVASKTFGEKSPNTALFKEMLATVLYLKNQLKKAINIQKQVYLILQSNNFISFSIASKYRLADYYLLNNESKLAKDILETITEKELIDLTDIISKSKYYGYLAWSAMLSNDLSLAKTSINETKELLKYLKNKEAIILLYFRTSQLAGLEKNYQYCYDNAKKATDMATKLYPKTWQLPNAYRYLQDVCKQKLDGIENNIFSYLQAVLNSPWKQETVITTKILNQN